MHRSQSIWRRGCVNHATWTKPLFHRHAPKSVDMEEGMCGATISPVCACSIGTTYTEVSQVPRALQKDGRESVCDDLLLCVVDRTAKMLGDGQSCIWSERGVIGSIVGVDKKLRNSLIRTILCAGTSVHASRARMRKNPRDACSLLWTSS